MSDPRLLSDGEFDVMLREHFEDHWTQCRALRDDRQARIEELELHRDEARKNALHHISVVSRLESENEKLRAVAAELHMEIKVLQAALDTIERMVRGDV